jgi:hypothetical protein
MIEWRWSLEPMTMRDRYAKNFAEALFLVPPPADGWSYMSREGWVKVICEGPTNAECSAKLMALEGECQLAHVPVNRIGQGSKVVLEMKLTEKGPRASGISV